MFRKILAVMLAFGFILTQSQPVTAWQLAPSGKYAPWVIADGQLSICYGVAATEGVFVNRGLLQQYLTATWGQQGGNLTFVSFGLCDNDGSNIKVLWNRGWSCDSGISGNVFTPAWPIEYSEITVELNACYNINGIWDWTSNGPNGGWGQDTAINKLSIQHVLAHEVGHALGINHSDDRRSILAIHPNCSAWGSSQGLASDDTAALMNEYWEPRYAPWNWGHGWAPANPTCWG